tara:strand:+ start:115352 stop:115711 length:360 start_codon:yes stop_codon:yes gene_type:complete
MNNQDLFIQALRDAVMMSQQVIECFNKGNTGAALNILENRSRVINIVFHLDEKLQLESQNTPIDEQRERLTLELIQAINTFDDKIQEYLVKEKVITQNEIAKTHKNKENLKGYNLNNTK